MCGLTGFWDFKHQASMDQRRSILQNMVDQISFRGPDGQGLWIDEYSGLSLGHRRLSIIDLSTHAAQPMMSHNARFILTYNGEVYNFQELRQELLTEGASFKTHSDTEVIVEACARWGVRKASEKFIGMFAFALWDRSQKKLYLVRDRLGIKPLYWGIQQNTLFFGSQLKSFNPHPCWSPTISQRAVNLYFQYKYVPTPLSIYEGIFKLEPGHILTIDQDQTITNEKFWDLESIIQNPPSQTHYPLDEQEILETCDDLITDSVKRILISDVPVGCFLSGGIDSSIVATYMQSVSPTPIQTFSIGFEDKTYNEAPQAKQVAQFLGTNHHEEILTHKKCLEVIPHLSIFYDEPFSDSSQIPTYLVSTLAKKQVTVALSGDGGDELFGGYNRYKIAHQVWERLSFLPSSLRKTGSLALNALPIELIEKINQLLPQALSHSGMAHKISKLSKILTVTSQEEFYHLLTTQDLGQKMNSNDLFANKEILSTLDNRSFVETMQYWDMKTYLPDDVLTKVDRASMAVGLEARVPLLDHRLVEFSYQLPMSFKIRKGETKWVLKKLLSEKIPPHFFTGPKKGFAVPVSQWLRGPLKTWADDLINTPLAHDLGFLKIKDLWAQHLTHKADHHELLWSYLMYVQWYRTYH